MGNTLLSTGYEKVNMDVTSERDGGHCCTIWGEKVETAIIIIILHKTNAPITVTAVEGVKFFQLTSMA